jgi:hypothetical protein
MNGRRYFEDAKRRMHLEDLDPDEIQEGAESLDLKPGPEASPVGGHLTGGLKTLSAEDSASRHERSERFLKQPPQRFPAEEDGSSEDDSDDES